MADLDFKSRNEFRKGMRLRRIDEDPTYLSFMFLFHYNDHGDVGHSPLLDGTAERYLRNVVRDDVGAKYADNLKNFVRVLRRVNQEMPWFWSDLKGIEKCLNYNMLEPYRGAEDAVIEIGCLEENVELTAIGLMDLYKRSCFDFERYVEVVPKNLREFSMDVIISEVRVFQKDTNARNLGLFDGESQLSGTENQANESAEKVTVFDTQLTNKDFNSADVTPFIRLRFTHCEFDMNSIADYFADLSKNPELKRPTIKINWGTCRQIDQKLGANLFKETADSSKNKTPLEEAAEEGNLKDGAGLSTKDKYLDALRGRTIGKVEGALSKFKDAVQAQKESIANSFANPDQPGLVNNILDRVEDDLIGGLLLGNVHGLGGTINNIDTAIKTGSLNAIGNLVGDLVGKGASAPDGFGLGNVGGVGVDSTPDGGNLDKVHDDLPGAETQLGTENIHGQTAPDTDGPLNENAHE